MLASFIVYLQPLTQATIGNSLGKSLHGVLFHLLSEKEDDLARRLHDEGDLKPFTVSSLRGRFPREGNRRVVAPDMVYSLRYTTLSEELFYALSQVLLGRHVFRGEVKIDGIAFRVMDVAVEPDKSNGWGRISSAQEIWDQAQTEPKVELNFVAPTTFNQRGMNLLFPIPKNVFESYYNKWNAFTAMPIDQDFVPWVEQNVAVEAHSLETRMVWFTTFQKHGFTGWCRYVSRDSNPTRLKQWNALADFAFFCGTGQKTPQGMGQTRRWVGRTQQAETQARDENE